MCLDWREYINLIFLFVFRDKKRTRSEVHNSCEKNLALLRCETDNGFQGWIEGPMALEKEGSDDIKILTFYNEDQILYDKEFCK